MTGGAAMEEPAAPVVDAENPWPGLLEYRERDRDYFKGRDPEVAELHRRVIAQRTTVLFAASGMGKTSLVRAGLLPRLEAEILPVYLRLDHSAGAPPLIDQIKEALAREAAARGFDTPPPRPGESLWELLHRKERFWNARNRPAIPLLILDQFEELFTLGVTDAERTHRSEPFRLELVDLVEGQLPAPLKERLEKDPEAIHHFELDAARYRLLLCLREEYLPELESLRRRSPSILDSRWRLDAMSGPRALEVVKVGSELVDPGVADQIVRFVAGVDDNEPIESLTVEPCLLSLVCHELNKRRRELGWSRITAGLFSGSRRDILQSFYDRCMNDVPPSERRILEEVLVLDTGHRDTRAVQELQGRGVSPQTLTLLVDRRLLRLDHRLKVERVELAHDVMAPIVTASRGQRRQKARDRRLRQVTLAALVLLVISALATWLFVHARRESQRAQRALAEVQLTRAVSLMNDSPAEALARVGRTIQLEPGLAAARTMAVQLLASSPRVAASLRHQERIDAAVFSPDGALVLTGSRDHEARLWDAYTGILIPARLPHEDYVTAVAFSADGARFATASKPGIRVWDTSTRRELVKLAGHKLGIAAIEFSPDGRRLLTAGRDGVARIWDLETRSSREFAHEMSIEAASYSPDARFVVTASLDATARLWDAATGRQLRTFAHTDAVFAVGFSRDSKRVVTGSADRTARIWDVETGGAVSNGLGHRGQVTAVAFGPNDAHLATASDDGSARIWEVRSGWLVGTLVHDGVVWDVDFSRDGNRVVTAAADGTARVWDVERDVAQVLRHPDGVSAAAFNTTGDRVLSVGWDRVAYLWDARPGHIAARLEHPRNVVGLKFDRESHRLLTLSADRVARIWDVRTAEPLVTIRHDTDLVAGAFQVQAGRAVTVSVDGIYVWDTAAPPVRPIREMSAREVRGAAFSDDGLWSTTLTETEGHIWNLREGRLVATLSHDAYVAMASFNHDATQIVTAAGTSAHVWAAPGGRAKYRIAHEGAVLWASFSPGGDRLITASSDRTARLWDAETGIPLAPPLVHYSAVKAARFTVDGRRILTVSDDRTVRVWDSKSGAPSTKPLRHRAFVHDALFSPDATRIVTVTDDKALVWDAASGELVASLPIGYSFAHRLALAPDGNRIAIADENAVRIWDVPSFSEREAPQLSELAYAVSGLNVADYGGMVAISDRNERLERLQAGAAGALRGEATIESFTRWILEDPWERAVSPLSRVTAKSYICGSLRNNAPDEANAAYPGHSLLRDPAPIWDLPLDCSAK